MKKLFFPAIILLILFEIALVYFIMPMPGSQRWNVVDFAHFINAWRWPIRILLYTLLVLGVLPAFKRRKFLVGFLLLITAGATWAFNFPMTASQMFQPIGVKKMAGVKDNKIHPEKLVIAVEIDGDARAYPIEMIGYHHRVFDTVGGKRIMVTYCTVCRTGRVFEPAVNGKQEEFRLVGMDHFNAMFEDKTTGTWWRQATGEACAGTLKGAQLPTVPSVQLRLDEWQMLHPNGKILQWDTNFSKQYKAMSKFDRGTSKSKLTGSNTAESWKEKSWVIGLPGSKISHVYDWRTLYKDKVRIDTFEGRQIVLWIGENNMDFFVFEVPHPVKYLPMEYRQRHGDTVMHGAYTFTPDGFMKGTETKENWKMQPVQSYQEFWHSWRTFRPGSKMYPKAELK